MTDKEKEEENTTPGAPAAEPQKPETPMIPKDRFDQVISERNSLKVEMEKLEKREQETAKASLAEQGKFKELYEAQLQEAEKARSELATLQHNSLRRDIAAEAGYPDFWNRIQGSNAEELQADMKALIEVMPKAKAPNIDAGTGSGKRSSEKEEKVKMNEAQRKYLASVLNVPVEHLPEELEI